MKTPIKTAKKINQMKQSKKTDVQTVADLYAHPLVRLGSRVRNLFSQEECVIARLGEAVGAVILASGEAWLDGHIPANAERLTFDDIKEILGSPADWEVISL